MHSNSTVDSQAIVSATAQLVPGMRGFIGPSPDDWLQIDAGTGPTIRRLYNSLALRHPEAGRAFWAVRCWSWLIWQPVALCVASVHGVSAAPPIQKIGQRIGNAEVIGYSLPETSVETGDVAHMTDKAGAELREHCEEVLDALNRIVRMKKLIARRLLADRLMGTLAAVLGDGSDSTEGRALVCQQICCWLSATDLAGVSKVRVMAPTDGQRRLVLESNACCLEYLLDGAERCENCLIHARRRGDFSERR